MINVLVKISISLVGGVLIGNLASFAGADFFFSNLLGVIGAIGLMFIPISKSSDS
jgi:hypothetical protein